MSAIAEPTPHRVSIALLGSFDVRLDGSPILIGAQQQRLLLGYLAFRIGSPVSTDSLIEQIWGDEAPSTARKTVQVYISNLRKALGGEGAPIISAPGGYVLSADKATVDVARFDALVAEATSRQKEDPAGAVELLREGLSLWRGAPYSDLDAPSFATEIARLDSARLTALEQRMECELVLGHHAEVLGELEALTLDHPFRERLRAQHMLALYRAGRQTDALRSCKKARDLLVEELGIDPSPELQELEQRILEQDPVLDLRPPAADQRLVTLLATDLENGDELWDADPEATHRALDHHQAALRDAIGLAGGVICRETSGGVLAAMVDADAAVRAAESFLHALREQVWPTIGSLRVRVAIDAGVAEYRDGDYYGPPVNNAMRIMASGHAGQVLLSAAAVERLSAAETISLGTLDFKGIGRIEVHQLTRPGAADTFLPLRPNRMPTWTPRPAVERAIQGYELRERLGEGDFGIVYRGYQPAVGREVAIKVIRPEYANQASFVRRFESEARLVAQLEHPHIVSLYDFWRAADGAYLVMPWLRGGSLHESLRKGAWRPPAAMRLLDQIGSALAHAHRQGVLHRDVKPANVLLDLDGNAYLSDFGIAARHAGASGGPLASSPAYMSPEEAAGGEATTASDVYAIGLLAYALVTGERPEPKDDRQRVTALHPELPVAIDHVLDVATASDPDARYPRVEDFLRSMRQALGVDVVAADAEADSSPVRNPFKGLQAFQERDALDFFGRDSAIRTLVDKVEHNPIVAVVGPSGSGKSSLVRAGLLPRLRAKGGSEPWLITEMYPGRYPFEELEAALRRVAVEQIPDLAEELQSDGGGLVRACKRLLPDDGSRLLIVVDQFEELFSLTPDEQTRKAFLASLVAVAADPRSRVSVVATLRADFFDRPLEYPEFGELIELALVPVAMPLPENLAVAVGGPARSVGLDLEPGLITAIVRDVTDQPGGLPLMQHALTELFERRKGRTLSLDTYEESGGVLAALSRRAEEIYGGLGERARSAARQVFLRLVRADEESDDTRRRVRQTELYSLGLDRSAVDDVLQAFGSFRLLSFDRDPVTRGPTVEVAHEALITRWHRLSGWVDDRRGDLMLERRLGNAAEEWAEAGHNEAFLLRGGRLAQFENLAGTTDVRLTSAERDYIDASNLAEEAERRRNSRRRKVLTRLWAAATLIGITLTVFAVVQRNDAGRQRDSARDATVAADEARSAAEQETVRADAERVRAEAAGAQAASAASLASARELILEAEDVVEFDPELSLLLVLEAVEGFRAAGDVPLSVIKGLRGGISAARVLARIPGGEFVDVDSSGTRLVTAAPDGLAIWDLKTMELVETIVTDGARPLFAEFSPTGSLMAVTYVEEPDRVTLHDLDTGESTDLLIPVDPQNELVGLARFSPDGSLLAVETTSALGVQVWSIDDRSPIFASGEHGLAPSFSPAGELAFAFVENPPEGAGSLGARDRPDPETVFGVRIVDAVTGEVRRTLPTDLPIGNVDWSPDGTKLVVSGNRTLAVLDAKSGAELMRTSGLDRLGSPRWAVDGTLIVAGGESVPKLVDPDTGIVVAELFGHQGGASDVAAIPGSNSIATAAFDGTTIIFDGSSLGGVEVGGWEAPLPNILHTYYSPDGSRILVAGPTGAAIAYAVADAIDGKKLNAVAGDPGGTWFPTANEDGTWVVYAPRSGRWVVRSVGSNEEIFEAEPGWTINAVNFNASLVVTHEPNSCVTQLIETSSAAVVSELAAGCILRGTFAPDSQLVLIHGATTFRLFSATTGELVVDLGRLLGEPALSAKFTPAGDRLVVGSGDGIVSVLDMLPLLRGASLEDIRTQRIVAHDTLIIALNISSDGTRAVTGAFAERLKLWDLNTGTQLDQFGTGDFEGFGRHDGDFHPTLPQLVVTTPPNQVRIHTLDVDDLIRIAASRIHREMTDEECERYLHLSTCP